MWTINSFQKQHQFLANTSKVILEDSQLVIINPYAYTVSFVMLYVIRPESTYLNFTLLGDHAIVYSF